MSMGRVLYPFDGGLKPQVRAIEDTPSIFKVIQAEMDAGRFSKFADDGGRPVMPEGYSAELEIKPTSVLMREQAEKLKAIRGTRADLIIVDEVEPLMSDTLRATLASLPDPYTGSVWIDGKEHSFTNVKLTLNNEADGDLVLPPFPEKIEVSGTLEVTFADQALFDEMMGYDPLWKRELMWAVHNLFAHPVSEIAYWIGALIPPVRRFGEWLHDRTIPNHSPETGRG